MNGYRNLAYLALISIAGLIGPSNPRAADDKTVAKPLPPPIDLIPQEPAEPKPKPTPSQNVNRASSPEHVRVYAMKHASAGEMAAVLRTVLKLASATVDERTNTLVVNGSKEAHAHVVALLQELDRSVTQEAKAPPLIPSSQLAPLPGFETFEKPVPMAPVANKESVKILFLRNIDAVAAASSIKSILPKLKLSPEARTNSVLVLANEEEHQQVAAMLLKLDSSTDRQAIPPKLAQPIPSMSGEVAALRAASESLERQARDLADRLRSAEKKTSDSNSTLPRDPAPLREAVGKAYDARMKVYETELRQLRDRVQRLESAVRQQSASRDSEIKRRVDRLLAESRLPSPVPATPFDTPVPSTVVPQYPMPQIAEPRYITPPSQPQSPPVNYAVPSTTMPNTPTESRLPPATEPQIPRTQPSRRPRDAFTPDENNSFNPPANPQPNAADKTGRVVSSNGNVVLLRQPEEFVKAATKAREPIDRWTKEFKEFEAWCPNKLVDEARSFQNDTAKPESYASRAKEFHRLFDEYQTQMRLFEIAQLDAESSLKLQTQRAAALKKQVEAGTIPTSELNSSEFERRKAQSDVERIATVKQLYGNVREAFGPDPQKVPRQLPFFTRPETDIREVLWRRCELGLLSNAQSASPARLRNPLSGGLRIMRWGNKRFSPFDRVDTRMAIIVAVEGAATPTVESFLAVLDRHASKPLVHLTVDFNGTVVQIPLVLSGTLWTVGEIGEAGGKRVDEKGWLIDLAWPVDFLPGAPLKAQELNTGIEAYVLNNSAPFTVKCMGRLALQSDKRPGVTADRKFGKPPRPHDQVAILLRKLPELSETPTALNATDSGTVTPESPKNSGAGRPTVTSNTKDGASNRDVDRIMSGSSNVTLLRSADDFIKSAELAFGKLDVQAKYLKDLEEWAPWAYLQQENPKLDSYAVRAREFHRLYEEYQTQMRLLNSSVSEAKSAVELQKANRDIARRQAAAGAMSQSEDRAAQFALSKAESELERISTIASLYNTIKSAFGPNPDQQPKTWTWKAHAENDPRDILWKRHGLAVRRLTSERFPVAATSNGALKGIDAGLEIRDAAPIDGGGIENLPRGHIIIGVDKYAVKCIANFLWIAERSKEKKFVDLTIARPSGKTLIVYRQAFPILGSLRYVGQINSDPRSSNGDRRWHFIANRYGHRELKVGMEVLVLPRNQGSVEDMRICRIVSLSGTVDGELTPVDASKVIGNNDIVALLKKDTPEPAVPALELKAVTSQSTTLDSNEPPALPLSKPLPTSAN